MIKTIRHKGLKSLFETGRAKGIRPDHVKRCQQILALLDKATNPNQMAVPGLQFHPLKQYDPWRYSLWVSAQWRITFEWEGNDAVRVDLEQYH